MEDFATFEIALKLKEKGFNIPFYFYYRTDDKLLRHAHITNPLVYGDKVDDEVIIAPTISRVLKWFREEYKIYMYVERDTYHLKFRFVYEKDKPRGKFTSSIYDGFEQAALAGIEYVLDNLI